ncbi:MAG: hypothetical protein ACRC7O_07645 [Fimbriiglobus sp.]
MKRDRKLLNKALRRYGIIHLAASQECQGLSPADRYRYTDSRAVQLQMTECASSNLYDLAHAIYIHDSPITWLPSTHFDGTQTWAMRLVNARPDLVTSDEIDSFWVELLKVRITFMWNLHRTVTKSPIAKTKPKAVATELLRLYPTIKPYVCSAVCAILARESLSETPIAAKMVRQVRKMSTELESYILAHKKTSMAF